MFTFKGEMVCSGGFDEMGKQMAADYCIPEKNGDWYVSIFDDCLNHAFKKIPSYVFTALHIVQFNAPKVQYLYLHT